MNRDEIQQKLNTPTEIFQSGTGDEVTVNLAYPIEKEAELRAVALALKELLKGDTNSIEINKEPQGKKYNVIISSPQLSPPLFFGGVACEQSSYDELLFVKANSGQVKLAFYIYQKQVKPSDMEVAAAKKDPNYDEHAVVQPEEPHFISVEIPVEGQFSIKSDDQFEDPASFVFLKQDEALAVADAAKQKGEEAEKQ